MSLDDDMRQLSLKIARLVGVVNIQREAISIWLKQPPDPIQTDIALLNARQKLIDLGLDKTWDEAHLAAYHDGIEKTLRLLWQAILKAQTKIEQESPHCSASSAATVSAAKAMTDTPACRRHLQQARAARR